jgi:hypothetical protein
MRALKSGTTGATSEVHGTAAASVGAVGLSADPRALLRGMVAVGAGEIMSPRRLLAAVQAREGGAGSSKRARGTPK